MLAEHHNEIGVAASDHLTAGYCVVILFASQIVAKNSEELKEYQSVEKQPIKKNWEKFNQDIFELQNKIRKDPRCFITHLEKVSRRFTGLKLYNENNTDYLMTKEGVKAYQDGIKFLKNQRAMKPLEWSDDLQQAAKDHVEDAGKNGLLSG